MKKLLAGAALALLFSLPAHAEEITLGRFFGACENAGTDTKTSVGEACIIQSIINAANKELGDVQIKTLPTDWGNYYDQIKAAYAAGSPPNVHVMHAHMIPEFVKVGALADLKDDLAKVGIDPSDWADRASAAVHYKDGVYGIPMDFHANLIHVNMDLMAKAGLVKDGKPVMPTSPEELLAQAQQFKKATGENYLSADFPQYANPLRLFLALVWQQGGDILDKDGKVTVDTPEARKAIAAVSQLLDNDLADRNLNYTDSQQVFINGHAGILMNGTWVVDEYSAQAAKPGVALKNYYAADFFDLFGTPATWAGNHVWAIPAKLKAENPEKYMAALKAAAFIYNHNADWARTGHMAIRKSVLNSEEYKNLPHRKEYAGSADMARSIPSNTHFSAVAETLTRELQAIWVSKKNVDTALADAQADIEDAFNK